MRAHYFQHVPFEGLGSIESWLYSRNWEITCTRFFESVDFPDPEKIDFLVIMGGPMSVNDEDTFPWLVMEKLFVRRCFELNIPVLGICLGAQVIANAMGAEVFPNSQKEIGWFPVTKVSPTEETNFNFPASTLVFHWHGETFDLPPGSTLLASSKGCKNQAFQIGSRVIGLQFHLETTPESARDIVAHCRHEIVPSTYIQTEEEILSANPDQYKSNNELLNTLLSYLLEE